MLIPNHSSTGKRESDKVPDCNLSRLKGDLANGNLQRQGRIMALSYVEEGGRLWKSMRNFGLLKSIRPNFIFEDTHHALEYFEDELLKLVAAKEMLDDTKLSLPELLGLDRLGIEQSMMMADFIDREEYRPGEKIFEQDDPADAIYFISRGIDAITVNVPESKRVKRIRTLSFWTFFGEEALFGERVRSVNVEAVEPLAVFRISVERFARMKKDCPDLANAIVDTIGRTLAERLGNAYKMISELEI